MKTPLKTLWLEFRNDPPGKRFQNLYHRRRNEHAGRFSAERIVNCAAGVGLLAVGIVLLPAPGPGWVVITIALALLACECLAFARFLDLAEVRIRSWLPAKWQQDRAGSRLGNSEVRS